MATGILKRSNKHREFLKSNLIIKHFNVINIKISFSAIEINTKRNFSYIILSLLLADDHIQGFWLIG